MLYRVIFCYFRCCFFNIFETMWTRCATFGHSFFCQGRKPHPARLGCAGSGVTDGSARKIPWEFSFWRRLCARTCPALPRAGLPPNQAHPQPPVPILDSARRDPSPTRCPAAIQTATPTPVPCSRRTHPQRYIPYAYTQIPQNYTMAKRPPTAPFFGAT